MLNGVDEGDRLWVRAQIKVSIANESDFDWLLGTMKSGYWNANVPTIIQPATDPLTGEPLLHWKEYWGEIISREPLRAWMRTYNVRILPRLHCLLWGGRQGV